jgi:hypothetical protein
MPLITGDAGCTSGLSKRIYDARIADAAVIGISTDPDDHAPIKADCYAIATAVVAEIVANAVVTVAAGIPVTTSAPATGTTTAPGTGTVA